jgi:hypothetical protein
MYYKYRTILAALCGAMGYRWFFTPEWLETIISWQDKESGCYKGETIRESDVGKYMSVINI